MPIYTYKCSCGSEFDRFLALDDYKKPQTCECGAVAQKIIVPTMISCDMQNWESYESPCSGKLITSYKQRDADMKEHGCVDYDPGVKQDNINNQKREEAKLDKAVDETVEKAFDAMPVRKKEKLETELKNSTLEYDRN